MVLMPEQKKELIGIEFLQIPLSQKEAGMSNFGIAHLSSLSTAEYAIE